MDLLIVVVVSVARVCVGKKGKRNGSEKKGEEGFFFIVSDRNGLSSTSGRFY